MDKTLKPLDEKTLEALAELICGDSTEWYRKGWELPDFFRRAGLEFHNRHKMAGIIENQECISEFFYQLST
ncbi:hypothetical protein [Carboxydothermus pertinax]|uniref:hypothetical protein n=1 Tax=Carboxydothermus pertinax TaxID=870242 RepID=UPI00096A7F2F|nr:hypothetical protein [Carboxydothermus pertinax]